MSPDSEEGTETRRADTDCLWVDAVHRRACKKAMVTIVIAIISECTVDPDLCLSVFLCVCLCPSLCLCALAFQGKTGLSRVQLVQAARRLETRFDMLSC